MAKVEAGRARPLSPHLTIFRPYVNMMMSILHRMTGAANYFGSVLLAVWLTAAASGQEALYSVNSLLATPVGILILFGFSWSLIHHALGGIRHFIWDTGKGFSVGAIRALSWLTMLMSLTLTATLWAIGLTKMGVL
jgi:succinate dehydrogenase / fumarate reductase, cytochrome b subunit